MKVSLTVDVTPLLEGIDIKVKDNEDMEIINKRVQELNETINDVAFSFLALRERLESDDNLTAKDLELWNVSNDYNISLDRTGYENTFTVEIDGIVLEEKWEL